MQQHWANRWDVKALDHDRSDGINQRSLIPGLQIMLSASRADSVMYRVIMTTLP